MKVRSAVCAGFRLALSDSVVAWQVQTRIPRTQLVDNGSYAEYIVTVMVDGQEWTVHKRYREFDGASNPPAATAPLSPPAPSALTQQRACASA